MIDCKSVVFSAVVILYDLSYNSRNYVLTLSVHMTNCFSYYRFLSSCVIGLIVGGALNTHVELELELELKIILT